MNKRLKTMIAKLRAFAASPEGKALIAMYLRRSALIGSSAALPWLLPAVYRVTGTHDPIAAAETVAGLVVALAGIGATLRHSHRRVKKDMRTLAAVAEQRDDAVAVVNMRTTCPPVAPSTPPAAQPSPDSLKG